MRIKFTPKKPTEIFCGQCRYYSEEEHFDGSFTKHCYSPHNYKEKWSKSYIGWVNYNWENYGLTANKKNENNDCDWFIQKRWWNL